MSGPLRLVVKFVKPIDLKPMKVSTKIFVILLAGVVSTPAHAYLDPSTGSMIITAIVGLFASLALAIRTYWYKLKSLFRGKDSPEESQTEAEPEVPSDPASRNDG